MTLSFVLLRKRNTGILVIEKRAQLYRVASQIGIPKLYQNPFWAQHENAEMAVRALVRDELPDLLGRSISALEMKPLDEVLFDIVYPTLA
jgi:hypothetical protein